MRTPRRERAFGEAPLQLRYYFETAWARGGAGKSDAFGSAYPYGDRVQVIEAYAEWLRGGTALVGARGGRYRVPFGIYSASDHAYNGFVRAPLIAFPVVIGIGVMAWTIVIMEAVS